MITLDRRSGSFELLPHFPKGSAQLGNLSYGDASFLGNGPDGPVFVGLERKHIRDLISSMDSGRLYNHQLPGLLSSYSYIYICVEGLWRHGKGGLIEVWSKKGWRTLYNGSRSYPSSYITRFLNRLMVRYGVMVFRTDNQAHTSATIYDLWAWWDKPWNRHKWHSDAYMQPHPVSLLQRPGIVQCMAAQLPLVGWGRSKAVADRFGTVEEMVEAPTEEWEKIPGIGPVIAEKVWRSLHE